MTGSSKHKVIEFQGRKSSRFGLKRDITANHFFEYKKAQDRE